MTPNKPPSSPLAAGQTLRLPGGSKDAALHDQLYRYAEDLEQILERHGALESRYESLQASCDRLAESRAMLDDLIRNSRDIHIVTNAQGNILQMNPAADQNSPPGIMAGFPLVDWVRPSHRGNFEAMHHAALSGKGDARQEWELILHRKRPDQSPLIASAQVIPIRPREAVEMLHWILRDVTHQREIEFDTQISSMVFKNATEGVMITDVEGDILAVNPAFTRITGYSAEEAIGRNPRFLKSGIQDTAFYGNLWKSLREKGNWQGKVNNRRKSGEIYPEWLTISAARDNQGNILSYIAVFNDLSHLLQAEKELAYLAHHDTLTGLPNRLLFQERLTQTISQSHRFGNLFSIIFIDLDRFKPINDTHGHEVGDHVLKEIARRLADSVREVDTVARMGGDEFVILAPGLAGKEAVEHVCHKLINAMIQPLHVAGHALQLGASLGCAEYPLDGEDEVALLRHADTSMYRAKAAGGNGFCRHAEQGTGT
jgi:diguanylate cyclase (GGDEF)-like protein/PAS domain S-box-containing protein